jgi:hypothetical protein
MRTDIEATLLTKSDVVAWLALLGLVGQLVVSVFLGIAYIKEESW